MADKEREERVRRRDQIRKLQERLSNMEQEKRNQAQEMRKLFQEKLEMEEKGQKGRKDIERKERYTDPVRRSLTFDEEAEGVQITRRGRSLANAELSSLGESSLANADLGHLRKSSMTNAGLSNLRESFLANADLGNVRESSPAEDSLGNLSQIRQNTTEQTGVVVRKTYSAKAVTSTKPKERVDEPIDKASVVTSTKQRDRGDKEIGSSHRSSMADLLDHSPFRHEMPFDEKETSVKSTPLIHTRTDDKYGVDVPYDQESARKSTARTHSVMVDKYGIDVNTPDDLYGTRVTERSIEKPYHDDLTTLQKQVRSESDKIMSKAGDQDKIFLTDTPSIQRDIEQEDQRAEQRRKALLDQSAKLRKERERLYLSIKKERMREEFLAKQREIDEEIERQQSEMRELEKYEEEMRRRQEEEYREKMLERQRQEQIEERDREERRQKDMRLEKLRIEAEKEMYERRVLEERFLQEVEQEKVQRELDEERQRALRLQAEEEEFERKWKQKKDSIRKEMTIEQLQEERQLLEEIHQLKIQKEEKEYQNNSELAEERLSLLRKEREELLDKRSSGRQTAQDTAQDRKNHKEMKPQETTVKTETSVKTKPEKTMGKPKLPAFDGSQFEAWKMEVDSLLESPVYSDYILTHVIRNSIEGKARKVLLTLKPTATTAEILKKMEDIYGNIRSGDAIVQEFYSARQMKDEPCSEWGIRLETLFNQAVERGEIQESRKDPKLKERFWRGLVSEKIKVATRSAYESTTESFDRLRKKARIEELEIKSEQGNTTMRKDHEAEQQMPTDKKACMSMQNMKHSDDKIDKLKRKIESLETSLGELKARERLNADPQGSFGPPGRGRYPFRGRGGYGPPQDYERYPRGRGGYGPSRGNGRYGRDDNSTSRYAKSGNYEEEEYPTDDYSNSRYFYSKRDQQGKKSSSDKQQKSKN